MARRYGIGSLAEARAYLAHPVLGVRLLAWTALVNRAKGYSACRIFGSPDDDMKFRSSMTLFAAARPEEKVFQEALKKYFGGEPDRSTVDLLAVRR